MPRRRRLVILPAFALAAWAWVAVYLAAASISPQLLASWLGTRDTCLYHHVFLLAPATVAMISVLAAVAQRARWRSENIGLGLCSAGVVVLIVGAAWYTLAGGRGRCAATAGPAGWSAIDRYELDGSAAVYASSVADAPARATPLAIDRCRLANQPIDAPLAGPADVAMRATRYLPATRLAYTWANDAPSPMPAVRLRVTDGPSPRQVLLAGDDTEARQADGNGYTLIHLPHTAPQTLSALLSAGAAAGPAVTGEVVLIVTGPAIAPTAVVAGRTGATWHGELPVGQVVEVHIAGRSIGLELVELLDHAAHHATPRPGGGSDDPFTGEALEVQLANGAWRWTTYLPFTEDGAIPPQRVSLPGDRAIFLTFGPRSRALPARLTVDHTRYVTQKHSAMPLDYRSLVAVSAGGITCWQWINLNHPLRLGRYQITGGEWVGPPESPTEVHFLVTDQSAMPVIYAGFAMIAAGMPLAFYLRPILLRRRAR